MSSYFAQLVNSVFVQYDENGVFRWKMTLCYPFEQNQQTKRIIFMQYQQSNSNILVLFPYS